MTPTKLRRYRRPNIENVQGIFKWGVYDVLKVEVFGNTPMFLSITPHNTHTEGVWMAKKAAVAVFPVLNPYPMASVIAVMMTKRRLHLHRLSFD